MLSVLEGTLCQGVQPPVIEIESSSTLSTADISTDEEAPPQQPRPKPKPKPRAKPKPKPKPKPSGKPKPSVSRDCNRTAAQRLIQQRLRAVQEVERARRREARVQRDQAREGEAGQRRRHELTRSQRLRALSSEWSVEEQKGRLLSFSLYL